MIPSDPIFIAGFDQNRLATGVHDDAWARRVVLEEAGIQIALVTLDVVGYFNNKVRTARSSYRPERAARPVAWTAAASPLYCTLQSNSRLRPS